jgi:hypothetical protein
MLRRPVRDEMRVSIEVSREGDDVDFARAARGHEV